MTAPFVYAAIGDSTAVGYGAGFGEGYVDRLYQRIAAQKSFVQLHNLGSLGAQLATITDAQTFRAIRLAPDLVTFFAGTNDLMSGAGIEGILERLDVALRHLRALRCPVLAASLPDLCQSPILPTLLRRFPSFSIAAVRQRIDAFNAHLRIAVGESGFRLVDVFDPSRAALRANPDYFCRDGVHPSSKGYAAIAEAFWPEVASVLGLRLR